jgi:myosin-15
MVFISCDATFKPGLLNEIPQIAFTEVLEKWFLFGSSFFAVRRDADPAERSEHILALNRNGVHFLDVITHVN